MAPARWPGEEASLQARIAAVRAGVGAVTVDGRGGDWAAVPSLADPAGDAGGRAGLDLRSVAVVPTDEVVLVRLATEARPSRADRAFWLDLDVTGSPAPDLQVGVATGEAHFLRSFRPDGTPRSVFRTPLPAAVGEVVEVAVPMELLERAVRDRGPLRGPQARAWVRVTAFTWDRASGDLVDFASAGSVRIVPDPVLDEGAVPADALALRLPVEGRWLVTQGAFGAASHAGVRAWDLARVDEGMSRARPRDSCANEDFLGWEAPVRAPVAGRVLRIRDDAPDGSPCGGAAGDANEVFLEVAEGVALHLAHLRRGSLTVGTGDRVESGRRLGRVGNSGLSTGAHLHLGLVRTGRGGETPPLALRDVRVGLNPGADDPWSVRLERWVPREGWFVEAGEPRERPGDSPAG